MAHGRDVNRLSCCRKNSFHAIPPTSGVEACAWVIAGAVDDMGFTWGGGPRMGCHATSNRQPPLPVRLRFSDMRGGSAPKSRLTGFSGTYRVRTHLPSHTASPPSP